MKNSNLKASHADKNEELAQIRVGSETLKAEIARIISNREVGESLVESVRDSFCQKESLDESRDEISRLQNLLDETQGKKLEVEESFKGKQKGLSEARKEIAQLELRLLDSSEEMTGIKSELELKDKSLADF